MNVYDSVETIPFRIVFLKLYKLLSCLIALSSTKCGLVPNQVYLKRGERKQLIFWTDQNYDATSTKPDAGSAGEQVDLLLQLVNGAMPKPEQLFNTSEEEENYPQFQGVPSTTTTTTRTTTIVTETTTMIVEGTTSMAVAEVDTVISNEDSTVTQYPSETSTGALEEGSGDVPAAGDNVDEPIANNDTNDNDLSMDGVSSTTETLIQTDSPAIPATTLETMLEDDSTNTISPVIVLDNAEEIVEIVEPVIPSQEMDGPTPSIIMAETINPEEFIMQLNNELDEVTTTQGSMEDSALSDSVTEMAAGEGLQVGSHNKELPTTVATPLEILSATGNPLLSEGTQNAIEHIDDVNDTNNDEIPEMRTTISNVDGFHITVSHPIKQEPRTESPLDAIENEDSNPGDVLMPQVLSDDIDTGNSNTPLQSSEGNAEKISSSDEMTTISILKNSSEENSTFFEEEESTKVESTSNKGEINSSTINANEDDEIMDDDSEDYSSSLDSFQVSTKQNSSFNIEEDTKDTNGTDMSSTNNDDVEGMIQSVTSTNDGSRVQDQTLTVTTKAPSEMATEKDNNLSNMNNNNTEDRTESVPEQTNGVCQFIYSLLAFFGYHFLSLR